MGERSTYEVAREAAELVLHKARDPEVYVIAYGETPKSDMSLAALNEHVAALVQGKPTITAVPVGEADFVALLEYGRDDYSDARSTFEHVPHPATFTCERAVAIREFGARVYLVAEHMEQGA